ncbi:MAG: helix-turn-helix transcriptional regulator [Methylococcales bacterium]|nr:helix-turn-helix transcriptional regulator [Methylococcales bacterium]MCK5924932.1 helix-turn-helix transcriptional regulator [Methylococcales bacterium]
MNIHEKLSTARKKRHLSQKCMAKKLGMSVNGYAKIERGETRVYNPNLKKIADVLGLEMLELFIEDDADIKIINDKKIADENEKKPNKRSTLLDINLKLKSLQLVTKLQQEALTHKELEISYLREVIELLKHNKFSL